MPGPALLALGSGNIFFTALIVIPYALAFPGLFAPTGLLGAGPQSAPWLYTFWHFRVPAAVIAYVLLKNHRDAAAAWANVAAVTAVVSTMALVSALVCLLAWIAMSPETPLPAVLVGPAGSLSAFLRLWLADLGCSWRLLHLVLLWNRLHSVLDLWLMVVLLAFLVEIILGAVLSGSRFSVGFYAGRICSLITSAVVLIVLLAEITALYANLARSVLRQRAEREGRQIAMDAMAASIAHEINQPLGALVTNANASLRWLAKLPYGSPDLDEARLALNRVVTGGHRAAEIITSLRAMFKKDVRGRASLDLNQLILETLTTLDVDLRSQQVSVTTKLSDGFPPLRGDRGQLQQVFLNLIMNAIEAMGASRVRNLRVTSHVPQGSSAGVIVTVEDSGTGIAATDKTSIFEPFFTTKAGGTGIGLAICRSIVEAHGGSLAVSAVMIRKGQYSVSRCRLAAQRLTDNFVKAFFDAPCSAQFAICRSATGAGKQRRFG